MARYSHLLLMSCLIPHINGDNYVPFNNTNSSETQSLIAMYDNNDIDNDNTILLNTFFDLFWYIVALIMFCICCISCIALICIDRRRRYNEKIAKPISASLQNPQQYALNDDNNHHNIPIKTTYKLSAGSHISGISTISALSPITSPQSISKTKTKSLCKSPILQTNDSMESMTLTNPDNIMAISSHIKHPYSLSAFSGVDSDGIDIDDATPNIFELGAIPELNNAHSISSKQFKNNKNNYSQQLQQEEEEESDQETEVEDIMNMEPFQEQIYFAQKFVNKQKEEYLKYNDNDNNDNNKDKSHDLLTVFSAISAVTICCQQFETNDMIPNGTSIDAEPDIYHHDDDNDNDDDDVESTESSDDGNVASIIAMMKKRSQQ